MSAKILQGPELHYCANQSIGEFFFDCADRFSDRICQIDASLDKKETYSNVKIKSVRVALALQQKGITSQDVIVSCTKVTLDNVLPIIASFLLGSKIANLDPTLSTRQISHLLTLVAPKIIFVEEESVGLIEESLKSAKLKAEIVVFGESCQYSKFADFVKPHPNENKFEPAKVDIYDTAIIFFSSGTTGLPKAICHSHYSFLNVAYSFYEANGRSDSVFSFTSFYWVSASIILIGCFIVGGCRIFSRGAIDAKKTFSIIEKYKATSMFLAPILTYKLTSFDDYRNYDTSSLHTMLIGGTPISTAQLQRVKLVFKHTSIIFCYGCTEGGLLTIFNPTTDKEIMDTKLGSCGKVAPGVSIKVVDISTGELLGANQKGEIRAKSSTLMTGYYHGDSSPAFDNDGYLKTGDIGYYDEEGCFYVIERLKEMFKYMSWHIVPSSIEAVLLEHPFIKEAVVFGVPRSEEEGEVPMACVTLKENCTVDKKDIEDFVAERVADYEKLRGGIAFVDVLQKTPSGKLMRKEIRNAILQIL